MKLKMDIKIWEKAVVAWLNSLNTLSINSVHEINDSILIPVIRKIDAKKSSAAELLKEIFPNLTKDDKLKLTSNLDYLCVSTLLLIYVSLCEKEELKEIKDLMCSKLDNTTQLTVVQFLMILQEHEDAFNLSFSKIKQEIFPKIFSDFMEYQSTMSGTGDFTQTPVKTDANQSFESPLQGFFQTPKRNDLARQRQLSYVGGDGDYLRRIKQLANQLAEEESEKSILQEKLLIQTQKCNEYEMKLRNKIEEINNLKEEWEEESKKNEKEVNTLKNTIKTKLEYEKKLKNELTSLEKYVSTLELDIANCMSENEKLEIQLQESLKKFTSSESQLLKTSELCTKLQNIIEEKEKELEQFKENYTNVYSDEKAIDVSFINRSFDKSICSPENMGVIVDKLLREKIEENTSLQETIEELRMEKNTLLEKLSSLNKQLSQKCSAISELEFLNKELSMQAENFEKTEKELFKIQNELVNANSEISKLNKENSHLLEKYNILNNRLQEREQVLVNCKNSKALLHINFLRLAEDFKSAQQRLEFEVKNISNLALGRGDETPTLEMDSIKAATDDDFEKRHLSFKSPTNILFDQKDLRSKEEQLASFYASVVSDDKLCKLTEVLQNIETQLDWSESKASLQKTCCQLNENIIILKSKIRMLEEKQRVNATTTLKLEKSLKEADEKISELQSENLTKMKNLQEELEAKEYKIKDLENLMAQTKIIEEKLLEEAETVRKEARDRSVQVCNEDDHKASNAVSAGISEQQLKVPSERQEFNDSLEEVPVTSKTFDIVNLEEKNSDKTFSVRKENLEAFNANIKGDSTWVISPPPKVVLKPAVKDTIKNSNNKRQGEMWVVPFDFAKNKEKKSNKVSSSVNDLTMKTEEMKYSDLQKEVLEFAKECERLKDLLFEVEQKRKDDRENFEKNQEVIRQAITSKYESQLEHLKIEMKQLYTRELAKHKQEQSALNSELRDQNKRYKEHIDELRNQLWDLREKLLHEQTSRRDVERNYSEMKEKYESILFLKESDLKNVQTNDVPFRESTAENVRTSIFRHLPNVTFPTIPTEDEEEVFDNRFLEDMKKGTCKVERPEDRLKELQYRNSLCLPHLKSSYPGETQFHNPTMFKETDLKLGLLQFPQESQSLTDSDHSMTKSLLPDSKAKKKEQTSYKRPGPPTPSKNGGRLSLQSGDMRLTPRNVLKELNDQNERNRVTPNPLKLLLSSRNVKPGNVGIKDENSGPVTPRKKKFFRKPFGARDH